MSSSFLKKLGGVTGALVLLWVVYLYRQVPHSQSPFAKADKQTRRVLLEQGPNKVELVKQGEAWKVASGSGLFHSVEENQVETLLSGLAGLQLEDQISDRSDRAADYEVNVESGTRVHLFGDKEAVVGDGIFGKPAPDYAHNYFRFPDKPEVYLARGISRSELGTVAVNAWRSRLLVNIPETKIQAITMEGKGFKTELVRTSTDVWTMGGKFVEPGPVNALVGSLAHLRANDFVDPAAFPALTYEGLTNGRVLIKSADALTELKIGAEDKKTKQYPVSIGKEAGLAWLSEAIVQSLQQKPAAFKDKK